MFWSRALGRFLLSSRLVYLLLALVFVLLAHWPAGARHWVDWLNQRTLALAYDLNVQPAPALSIAVAQLPADDFADFARASLDHPLYKALQRLRQRHQAFHVFLPEPLWLDQLLGPGAIVETLTGEGPLQARLAEWQAFRTDGRSLWFLPPALLPEAAGEPLDFVTDAALQSGLLAWLLADNQLTEQASLAWPLGPYAYAGTLWQQPLWWQKGRFKRIQGPALQLAVLAADLPEPHWSGGLLRAGDWVRKVPANGELPVDWRLAPHVVGFKSLMENPGSYDLVLVASEGDALPLRVAAVLNTLLTNHYPTLPYWAWLSLPFWPLLLCLLSLPVWAMRRLWPALVGGILLTALLVALQLGAQLLYGLWLPVGAMLLWLWLALAWRLWCAWRGRDEARLERSWAQAWSGLVRDNIQAGKLAEAEAQWLEASQVREADWQLATGMALAQAYEKQRRYEQAEQFYRRIADRAGRYQDVHERIKRLQSLSGGNGGLDATLIIDEQIINKPVLGRYEIQRELGRGAMGIVYLGRDPKIARMVAIKTLQYKQFDASQLPDLKARFFREAEAAGRLSHPNIVSVFDVGEESDLAYIAMDYVPGRALSFYTSANRLLPVNIVYGLMAKAADALHYAHKHNVVHRDVKPGNLLYDPESGRLKVSDFGIARLVDNSKTRTGDVMGSPLYMSPEQLKGDKVSEAADIYSLGVTMYQLLTGKLPYDGDSLANLTYQILNAKHPSVRSHRPELPPSATRITNKALQKSPADRFASAREMAEALRKALARDFG